MWLYYFHVKLKHVWFLISIVLDMFITGNFCGLKAHSICCIALHFFYCFCVEIKSVEDECLPCYHLFFQLNIKSATATMLLWFWRWPTTDGEITHFKVCLSVTHVHPHTERAAGVSIARIMSIIVSMQKYVPFTLLCKSFTVLFWCFTVNTAGQHSCFSPTAEACTVGSEACTVGSVRSLLWYVSWCIPCWCASLFL